MDALLIVIGLALLAVGGDALVRGAVGLAKALGVSPLFIGLVLVGFGTSAPELTTSIQAAVAGSPGVAVGNVVGSNIANVLLILALAALVRPLGVDVQAFRRDASALSLAMIAATAVIALEVLNPWTGAALLAALLAYVAGSYVLDKRLADAGAALHAAEAESAAAPAHWGLSAIFAIAGLAGVIGGAWLLVTGAVGLAAAFGAPEAVIGLTLVAVGTSLPELAASLAAARRGQGAIAFGNIIGQTSSTGLGSLGRSGWQAQWRGAEVSPSSTSP